MRVLCVCHCGVTRSVGFAWCLRERRIEAIPVAWWRHLTSDETFIMLLRWCDKVVLAQPVFLDRIPNEFKNKVLIWDVGPDEGRYKEALNPELQRLANAFADRDFGKR